MVGGSLSMYSSKQTQWFTIEIWGVESIVLIWLFCVSYDKHVECDKSNFTHVISYVDSYITT